MKISARAEQISDWKLRRGQSATVWSLLSDIDKLEQLWSAENTRAGMCSDFYPMRLVTILEVFFRETVAEITDSNPARLERAAKLAKDTKLDFSIATNLYQQKLSIGDFIAHTLPASSIDRIFDALNELLPGFRSEVTTVVDRWDVEINGRPAIPIIGNVESVMIRLRRLFNVRHIVTHELPAERCYDSSEIEEFVAATRMFIRACDAYVTLQLHGKVPLTQTEMNQHAGDALEQTKARMQSRFKEVLAKDIFPDPTLLQEGQRLWEKFAEGEANLEASKVEGGSMYPMIWASTMEALIEDRIGTLDRWLDHETK